MTPATVFFVFAGVFATLGVLAYLADVTKKPTPEPVWIDPPAVTEAVKQESYTGRWGVGVIVMLTDNDGYALVEGGGDFILKTFPTRRECMDYLAPWNILPVPDTPYAAELEERHRQADWEIGAMMATLGYPKSAAYGVSCVKADKLRVAVPHDTEAPQ